RGPDGPAPDVGRPGRELPLPSGRAACLPLPLRRQSKEGTRLMKSVSNPTSGTTPDPRSLTDLWREFDASICDRMRNGASPERDRAYFEANVKFLQRLDAVRSEEHTSELQSRENLVCRLLLEKKNKQTRR